MAARENETEAAPAVADKGPLPMAAQENETEAAPAVADKGPPPMAALEDEVEVTGKVDAAGAAPAAVTGASLPAAAPEETTRGEETAEEAGGQVADRSPPLAAAPKRCRLAMGVWAAITAMLAVTGLQYPEIASGFTAYDCANTTNRVDVYSLLEPAACPTTTSHHSVERTIFGEIVQIKTERRVPVYRCSVIETVISQYCGI